MGYTTVLFDADGTLLDFLRSEREAVRDAMARSGIFATEEQLDAYSAINDSLWKRLERGEIERSVLLYRRFELFCERFGYTADAKAIAADYIETLSTKGYLLEGARALLDSLLGRVRMYMVTNGLRRVQLGRYADAGLEKYFDGLFISEDIGANKPNVRFFEYVAAHIEEFDAASTIVVGDSLTSDIKGANNACLDCCWYAPHGGEPEGIAEPTYVARSFEQVYNIIMSGGQSIEH